MYFDNPMPMIDPEADPDAPEYVDLDTENADRDIRLQEQLRQQVESSLNLRSFLHGIFYFVLLFVLLLMFLEVEFDIIDHNHVNGMIALVLVLGGASVVVKSNMDDRVYDPNYIPSDSWRLTIFIFLFFGEIFLFLLIRDLVNILTIEGLIFLVLLVGAVNIAVLSQFVEEEFDDYLEPASDKRTVIANYGALVILSIVMFIVRDNVPTIKPITNALSLFVLIFYSGFFWTYALFDRETINTLSRIALSFMISILLLPLALLILDRLGLGITPTVIIVTNFVLCSLGFLTYNARPRLKRYLYMG